MILKLNEEKKGLKLIQVNDGFVVVDLKAKMVKNDFAFDLDGNPGHNGIKYIVKVLRTADDSYWNKNCDKIIFATQNLNLEGVPVIEEKQLATQLAALGAKMRGHVNDYGEEFTDAGWMLDLIYEILDEEGLEHPRSIDAGPYSAEEEIYILDTIYDSVVNKNMSNYDLGNLIYSLL